MRLIWLLFIALTFKAHASACFIETYDQVLILSNEGDFSSLIKKSDCDNEELGRFVTFAQNAQGLVTAKIFNNAFPSINLRPARVQFHNLEEQLSMRGILPTEGRVVSAKRLNGNSVISFNSNQRLEFDCSSCPSTGDNTIKVTTRDSLGTAQATNWVGTSVGVPVKALVATKNHRASLKPIDATGFVEKTIISTKPQSLLNKSFPVHFYKLSKNISPGETLLRSQVSPVQLVRPGTEVRVTLKDAGITINGTAQPLSYGVLGQVIKLKNTRSSRIIWGKVVDTNSVVVEL